MEDFYFLQADNPMWPASANVFSIRDEEGLILIDVGCGLKKFTSKLLKKMDEFKLNLKDVHTIVISHAHPDHMGAMDEILKQIQSYGNSQPQILINEIERESALDIDLLNDSFDVPLIKEFFKTGVEERFRGSFDINKNFEGLCRMSQLPKDCNMRTIKDNDVIKLGNYNFRVITTPGHALGHTSFYELNSKFLLSGDLIGEKGTAWYSPSSGGAIGYLSSLDKIEKLPINLIYPSHGNKFTNVKERIAEIRKKILIKDQLILDKLQEGPQTMSNLISLFYPERFAQIFPGLAIVESHLIKLEQEKTIERNKNYIWKV
ncbi:MAG TPA: MBL fold metallo-hydrolase [Candidatus Deferrimicrobium sp.]|nr:MBL fold metallo-hydrolase [Candidatus Deferrimicrobium sp.]